MMKAVRLAPLAAALLVAAPTAQETPTFRYERPV